MPCTGNNKHKGFTLIELMIVILILGILVVFALPSFSAMVSRMSANSAVRSVSSAINLARSEAVKRGQTVVVCASSDGIDCTVDAWNTGWIVFVDNNDDADGAANSVDAGDLVIQAFEPLAEMTLTVSADLLQYNGQGFSQNLVIMTLDICPVDNNMEHARQLEVSVMGRARMIEGVGC